MIPNSFTVRVYGLLIHNRQVLLSRENIKGKIYTKFPGGGLEFGEGVIDCLKREFMEEVSIKISETELFHINENFLPSAFHHQKQVISIYYIVNSPQVDKIATDNPASEHLLQDDSDQVLYWAQLDQLDQEPIQLPVDQEVIKKLQQELH